MGVEVGAEGGAGGEIIFEQGALGGGRGGFPRGLGVRLDVEGEAGEAGGGGGARRVESEDTAGGGGEKRIALGGREEFAVGEKSFGTDAGGGEFFVPRGDGRR